MPDGDSEDPVVWKARKATQNRGSADSSDATLKAGPTRTQNLSFSNASPFIARKTIPVISTERPVSSTLTEKTFNTPVRSKFSAKRGNISGKHAQPRGLTIESTASTSRVVQPVSSSGQTREIAQPARPLPRHTPRGSPVYLSELNLSAKKAKSFPKGRQAHIKSSSHSSTNPAGYRVDTPGSATPPSGAVSATPTKSYRPLLPLWQQLDNEYEDRMQLSKRDRDENTFIKRISSRASRHARTNATDVFHINMNDPDHSHAHIAPKLKLRSPDLPDDTDSDDGLRYAPQVRLAPNRKAPGSQRAMKAARKYQSVESSPESSSENSTSSSLSAQSSEEVDELDSDQYDFDPRPQGDEDIEMEEAISESKPSERTTFEIPLNTVPLPASSSEAGDTIDSEPSAALISAVEALTLPSIRMQITRQLPFLLRNLRKGFRSRCRELGIPIYHDGQGIKTEVRYEHTGNQTYKAEMSHWRCPLCDLFGIFQTREMLDFHLKTDHPEVYSEWQGLENVDATSNCRLLLVIPELLAPVSPNPPGVNQISQQFSSPFPSLSLSPPSQEPSSPRRTPKNEPAVTLYFKRETQPSQNSLTPSRTPETSFSTRRSQSAAGTATITSNLTVSGTPHSPNPLYPAPPPRENPLGPAATPPYLPAHSDYGGPTVYYSSRPGGPCLFDLLSTLPMEKFGLLDWEVLDREDEIYESDDVKEEYKVMHALWARWIILNRNEFIADYFKGAKSFVTEYWKIIHQAAGWAALRYFLFILLANQFLNGHEVAEVLLHYEKHTGMEFWYD